MAVSTETDLFPEDIIETILTRLPVKSLCRFKCVSKPWLSLISSKGFVKAHLRTYSPKFPKILTNHEMQHISVHSLISKRFPEPERVPYIDVPERLITSVIGSCNGLVCMLVGEEYIPLKNDLVLWNPSTGNHKQLPRPDIPEIDKTRRYGAYGLGYDESKDDYVVLGILFSPKGDDVFESQVKVYSCRTNSWKNIGQFLGGFLAYGIKCKFVGGKFYLPTRPEDSFNFPSLKFDIVSVDFENGVCAMVNQPDYGEDVVDLSLQELGGRLCVVCSCWEDNSGSVLTEEWGDVWIRKEDGVNRSSDWTKIASITHYASDPWQMAYYCYKPVVMLPSGKIILVLNHRLLVYDPEKRITEFPVTCYLKDFEVAHAYVESLIWPTEDENERDETSDARNERDESSDAEKESGETSDARNERDETSDAEKESGETSDAKNEIQGT